MGKTRLDFPNFHHIENGYSPKYYCVEDELTLLGIKDMLEGFLSEKSKKKEVNKPFIPILEMEYKKLKKEIKKV